MSRVAMGTRLTREQVLGEGSPDGRQQVAVVTAWVGSIDPQTNPLEPWGSPPDSLVTIDW